MVIQFPYSDDATQSPKSDDPPDGFNPEDMTLAAAIRGVEDIDQRKNLVKGLLLILQTPGKDNE